MSMPHNPAGREPAPLHEISNADYELIRDLLRRETGFELGPDRQYLVFNRLAPLAATYQLAGVTQLIARCRHEPDRPLREAIVEAMTINETSFFRGGPKLFETLASVVIPALQTARRNERRLRIWCGACSTGQEPYSLAMTLAERCPGLLDWRVELLATDVSERALEQARRGEYSQFEVDRGLPAESLQRHFSKRGDRWRVSTSLRERVEFRRHNLLDSLLLLPPPLDLVLLRNVLIYFEGKERREMFGRLRRVIAPDGYLVLGETETTLGVTDEFKLVESTGSCFRPS